MYNISRFISNLNIRSKLLLGYITAFILLLTIVGIILYPVMRRTIEANVESELNNTTRTILSMVRTAADASVKNYLRAVAEKNKEIVEQSYKLYQEGKMTEAAARKRARDILLSQTIGKTGYIYCVNSKGVASIHRSPGVENHNWSHFQFVQEQIKRKEGYLEYDWKNPGESKAKPKALYMAYFKPWDWIISASSYRDEFNQLVNINNFRDSILSIRFGKTGYPYIIDSKGNVIVHPVLTGNVYDVRDSAGRQFVREMCKEKNGKIIYTWRNPDEKDFREKLVIFNYIPEFDWIVVSSSYVEEFYEPLNHIRYIIVAVFIVSLFFLFLLTFLYSSYIVRNLNRLIHSFQTGSKGDLSVRITNTSKDEFGSLSEYFNNFMEELSTSNHSLHREIYEHKQSEANYRSVIENIQDVFYRSDAEGNLIMASPSFLTLLGYESFDDCLGQPVSALYYEPEKRAVFLSELQGKGSITSYEVVLKRKDGTPVTVETSSHFYLDDTGNIAGVEGIFQDITQRKQAEDDHRKLETQLIQAQKMEAVGTLAGGIAHDFNNILSGIIGYSELCLRAVQDQPKVHHNMEQVLKAAERAKELVQQILAFSRKAAQEKKPIAIAPIIKEIVRFMRASLPTTIEITQTINETSDVIMADLTQMHQVLMNLCTNAGHAMKETGGVLEIGLKEVVMDALNLIHHPDLKPGRYLELSVRDTGHGIPQENLGRIFDPYFTTKKTGEGTGLGLAVVHGIVKDHGGDLSVYSEVGKGTIFIIYLPLMEKQAEGNERKVKEVILRGKGETILFIDDEKMVVDFSRELLEELGYKVVTQTDPVAAIEVFKKNSVNFDIVITDKTMPRLTGFDVIRKIRAIRADIPVVLCSGYQDKEDMEKLQALGINQLITKPARINVLAKAIRDVLDKEQP